MGKLENTKKLNFTATTTLKQLLSRNPIKSICTITSIRRNAIYTISLIVFLQCHVKYYSLEISYKVGETFQNL
jgi:hypothetical protein